MPGADERARTVTTARTVLVATIVGSLVVVALALFAWPHLEPADAYLLPPGSVAAVVYATLGWLIARRASNPIGWLLLGEGARTFRNNYFQQVMEEFPPVPQGRVGEDPPLALGLGRYLVSR